MVGLSDHQHAPPPAWLMRQLQAVPYLQVRRSPDELLELSVAGGTPVFFVVEARSRIGRSEAAQLVENGELRGRQGISGLLPPLRVGGRKAYRLVATSKLVEATRELFRAGGVSWMERDTGRCCLMGRGLLVDTTLSPERPRPRERAWAATLAGRTGTYAETLLLEYASKPIKVSESAGRAGVSLGIANRVLVRLEEERLVRSEGLGPGTRRFLTSADGLLDLWATEERRTPDRVTGMYVWSSSPQTLYSKLSRLSHTKHRWALGGVAAANLFAPTLTSPPTPEIWIDADVAPHVVADALEGELTEDAPNLLVRQSRGNPALHHARQAEPEMESRFGPIWLISRPRAYVETASQPGRAKDVAANLRETLPF